MALRDLADRERDTLLPALDVRDCADTAAVPTSCWHLHYVGFRCESSSVEKPGFTRAAGATYETSISMSLIVRS